MKHRNTQHSSESYWTSSLKNANTNGVSPNNPGTRIITRVVGVTFEGRQAVVAQLVAGEQIILRREPANPYDANAIRVERRSCEQIGYIDRYKAATLAPIYDACGGIGTGTALQLIGGQSNGMSLGVVIEFTMPRLTLNPRGGYDYV